MLVANVIFLTKIRDQVLPLKLKSILHQVVAGRGQTIFQIAEGESQ